MKHIVWLLFIAELSLASSAVQTKIRKFNNTPGLHTGFTSLATTDANESALSGETMHADLYETAHTTSTTTPNTVISGNGYLLTGTGSNTGLQESTNSFVDIHYIKKFKLV